MKRVRISQQLRWCLSWFSERGHGCFLKWLFFAGLLLQISEPVAVASAGGVERLIAEPVFGAQVYLREAGQANSEILLLIHGLGDEAGKVWDDLLPELSLKYHVVVPDLPGFGRSSKGNHLYSPATYAAFLDWLVTALPDKSLSLVGHSLGGGIALAYAGRDGIALKRLVLIDSVGLLHHLAVSQNFVRQQLKIELPFFSSALESSLGRVAGLLLEKTSHLPLDPDRLLASEKLREKFLGGDPARIAGLSLVQTDFSLVLAKVAAPTWLLWGENDQISPLRIATVLSWNLSNAELKILPGMGHTPMQENPLKFTSILMQALSQAPESKSQLPLKYGEKIGVCSKERGRVFEGAFSALVINGCKDVLIKNVITQRLEITDSEVIVEHSRIQEMNPAPAIQVQRSRLTMTGVDISAATGIVTEQSRLDLAGVRFFDATAAIRGVGNRSSLLCSSSTKYSNGTSQALHVSRSLHAGEGL